LNDLRECKYSNKKLTQKLTEYEIRLANNNKEIENMKKFLNKYEVSSKIYLKIKNEKELDKVKASFNQKENNYILSIYKLEEEIKNLTSLLDHNQKYYHQCKNLEKEIEIGKKKNEELKFMFNQELHEKNLQKAIEKETEEDLKQKMENLNEIIEELKKEGDKRRKNDIENQIKIKKLNMNLDEKKENILMLNEELEWYIRELNKTNNDLKFTKIDLNNLENVILNKIKEKEKEKEKENNENENEKKEINESVQYNNYSLDNEKDKDKSNSEIPPLNLSLLIKNSPKSN
jgi:chromosome segregation ATPase